MTTLQQATEQIQALRKEIDRHAHSYYVLDSPQISDAEYDALTRQLKLLEAEYPELITPDSPTQRVGAAPVEAFGVVDYPRPLLSLGNVFADDELETWYNRTLKLVGGRHFRLVCEHKIDGLACALTYVNHQLQTGATRGDGFHGENITQNLRTIHSIPLSVPKDAPPRFEVRGEVYLPKAGFRKLNEQRAAGGLPLFANPRNAAAGSVRQLDPHITAERPLNIYIYGLGWADGKAMPESHWETMQYLKSIGFRINPDNAIVDTIKEAEEYYHGWTERREGMAYEADGVVIKVDSLPLQEEVGTVGNEPRGAIAYKFPAIQGTTRLNEIGISVGRTGSLNPYAILKPVAIGGVTISQAALHNEDDIKRKDIREGDQVFVQRAGEVIPEVLGPTPDSKGRLERSKEFDLLEKLIEINRKLGRGDRPLCPVCGAEVIRPEDEVMYYCTNAACPAQAQARIELFTSRGAMDIRGIGESMSAVLLREGLVKDAADLYYLKTEDLMTLDRMGEKSADNIISAIANSKKRPLERVLFALGIRHVGEQNAQILANRFGSIDDLSHASQEELMTIPSIGPKIAESISAFFRQEDNKEIIRKLKAAEVFQPPEKPRTPEEGTLFGREFVITGTLKAFSREVAHEKIRALGGATKDNVTRKTSYVVVGTEPGSKLARAQSLGVTILDEAAFLKLLGEPER